MPSVVLSAAQEEIALYSGCTSPFDFIAKPSVVVLDNAIVDMAENQIVNVNEGVRL